MHEYVTLRVSGLRVALQSLGTEHSTRRVVTARASDASALTLGCARMRRPAAVDALDEDQIRVGIPAYVDDEGGAAFKARYFFAELVRRSHVITTCRLPFGGDLPSDDFRGIGECGNG